MTPSGASAIPDMTPVQTPYGQVRVQFTYIRRVIVRTVWFGLFLAWLRGVRLWEMGVTYLVFTMTTPDNTVNCDCFDDVAGCIVE